MRKYKNVIWAIVIIGVIVGLVMWGKATPGQYDALAACLTDSGAKFYGAFWCPACQSQKKAFGKSQDLLPYVECSTPDGKGQVQLCKDKNIASYPTWEFADGSRLSGVVEIEELAEKSSCPLQ